MNPPELSVLERKALKARAHFLDPVVLIGEAGYTPAVLRELETSLSAHELIKVRVAGDDREARKALCDVLCQATGAAALQHIGKLLVLYRAKPRAAEPSPLRPGVKTGKSARSRAPKRNPVSGRAMASRPGQVEPSTRKTPSGSRPPRTARVRKSGQRSSKKAFQGD